MINLEIWEFFLAISGFSLVSIILFAGKLIITQHLFSSFDNHINKSHKAFSLTTLYMVLKIIINGVIK